MTEPVAAPASRNSPCPCGSGRRYKDCHGVLDAAAATAIPVAPAPRDNAALQARAHRMQEALALQKAGNLPDAIAIYERVIAEDPANFDALHMLGVCWFQSSQFDQAEGYLVRALALRSDVPSARTNLKLIRDGRQLIAQELGLCRTVLPRLSTLCRPPDALASLLPRRSVVNVLAATRTTAGEDLSRMHRVLRDPRHETRAWRTPLSAPIEGFTELAPPDAADRTKTGREGLLLVYGIEVPVGDWLPALRAAHVALVINDDSPCRILECTRELSDEGRRPIDILFTRVDLKAAVPLPGSLFDEWFPDRGA